METRRSGDRQALSFAPASFLQSSALVTGSLLPLPAVSILLAGTPWLTR
jgi:hypothetical protein